MTGQGSLNAVRELLLVTAVAVVGVLLALIVVFSPWHPGPDKAAPAAPVELRSPEPTATEG
ncbi:hypothetical protein [Salinispora fenicalii]|uniref:hypothetical protein n=1 Tax=Salinispora fenicalii TaxID=1137263 RepID=UPI000363F992|nr:hypothetical protein [Salinispora fenicalii]